LHVNFSIVGKLNERLCKVYTGEIVMAIMKMHEQRIMHRDLKPENILIDENLHIKIVSSLILCVLITKFRSTSVTLRNSTIVSIDSPQTLGTHALSEKLVSLISISTC
jgi:serine/threonine protein kinase